MGKPDFCLGENKGTDQLRSNCEADQRLCFRYTDSTIPLLSKSKISSLQSSSVLVQLGLCQTWSETPKTGFLASRLISYEPEQKQGHLSATQTTGKDKVRKSRKKNTFTRQVRCTSRKHICVIYLFFLLLLQNIDCGYSLELPHRGGSNMYPQSMFEAKLRKISKIFCRKLSIFTT